MNGSHTGGANSGWGAARGQSEVLGMVLLLGMVIAIGVTVLFFGVAMLDSLESETIRDSVHQSLDSTVETMTSVSADGDEVRELPLHDQADARYVADGEIRGGWYMDSDLEDGPPAYEDIDCQWSVSPLGALEYEYEDRTAVIQSGGIWESDGTGWRTHAEPTVNFVGSNASTLHISMSVMTIDRDEEKDLRRASVRAGDTDPADEFPAPSACDGPTPHGLIEIESSYADAWYDYLTGSTALGTADDDNLTVEQSGDTITIHVQGFADVEIDYPRVLEDHGMDTEQILTAGDNFEFEALVENAADEPFPECNFVFDVRETDLELRGNEPSGAGAGACHDIAPGEERTLEFFRPDSATPSVPSYREYLDPGNIYEYTIYPEDENGQPIEAGALDETGTFYYGEAGVALNVSEPRVDGDIAADPATPINATEETVRVSANVHNIGVENASDIDVTLDLSPIDDLGHDWYDDNDQAIDRSYGQDGTVTWELNRSLLLAGQHEFTISATYDGVQQDAATGYLYVHDAVEANNTEIFLDTNTEVDISVLGSELGYNPQSGNVDWVPVFIDVYGQPVNDEDEPIGDPERHEDMDWVDQNLNMHSDDRRLATYDYSFTVEQRISLMIRGQSYSQCSGWQDGHHDGEYMHRECATGDEYSELVAEAADTETEQTNTRVLDEDQNTLPELEPGPDFDHQLRPDEILHEQTDIGTSPNPDGSLDVNLGSTEYLFVFELTDEPEERCVDRDWFGQCTEWEEESADEYWERAAAEDGDPNFNDVLVHVDITPGGDPADTGIDGEFHDERSDMDGIGVGGVDPEQSDDTADHNVDTGSDEIIIG